MENGQGNPPEPRQLFVLGALGRRCYGYRRVAAAAAAAARREAGRLNWAVVIFAKAARVISFD